MGKNNTMIFIYSGQPRTVDNLEYHLEIMDQLRLPDIYVRGSFWDADLAVSEKIYELSRKYQFAKFEFLTPSNQAEEEHLHLDDVDNSAYGKRILSQFASISNSVIFAKKTVNHFEDHICVRIRPDLLLNQRMMASVVDYKLGDNDIVVPHVGHYIGVSDMFWLTNGQNMLFFNNLSNFTENFIKRPGVLNIPEIILREFITNNQFWIKYDVYNLPSILARGNPGEYRPHTKFYTNISAHFSAASVRGFYHEWTLDKGIRRLFRNVKAKYVIARKIDKEMIQVCKKINSRHT
jgi:hypothetical protein